MEGTDQLYLFIKVSASMSAIYSVWSCRLNLGIKVRRCEIDPSFAPYFLQDDHLGTLLTKYIILRCSQIKKVAYLTVYYTD